MFSQKRFVVFFVMTASLVFALACQSVTKVFSIKTPLQNTPSGFSQNSTNYEGDWKGTTSQGLEITFTVAYNAISSMKFRAEWEGVNCKKTIEIKMETKISPTAEATSNFTPPNLIKNGTFIISQDTSKVDGEAYTFTGTFSSFDEVSGTIEYAVTSGSCQGTKQFEWTATKISD